MVSIRLIYPYVNSRSYGSFSFVIDWYIPIAIPLFSIVLILFIIYNYEESIGIQLELKREVEESCSFILINYYLYFSKILVKDLKHVRLSLMKNMEQCMVYPVE
jgi:hypothetical protein